MSEYYKDSCVSIDRLTILAKDNLILSEGSLPQLEGLKFVGNSFNAYQIEIEYLDSYGDSIKENIAFINFYQFSKTARGIRVDFNPNRRTSINEFHEGWHTLDKILNAMIGKKRLSRIDIAFDVFDNRMSNYRYFKAGISKQIYARDGVEETIYYGSPMSDRQIRQYNKQTEQLKKGLRSKPWWRLELQLRTKYISKAREQIVEMLDWFMERDWSDISDPNDRICLIGLDARPDVYAEFSKAKKTRINKLRKNSDKGVLGAELLDVYEQQKKTLEEELARYLLIHNVDF